MASLRRGKTSAIIDFEKVAHSNSQMKGNLIVNTKTIQNTVANISKRVHSKCIACGFENGNGLHLKFETAFDKSVTATFLCDEAFEGYPGMLHGGIISLILDSAMGNCMFAKGLATVTVEMTMRFKNPVTIGQEAIVSARIARSSHPLYLLEASIVQNGKVKATAKGKYYDQPKLKLVN
jgi:uncharacterized protein (TIGR00369 family)